ncbi:PHD and RING finger domain-containing protein 1 [Dendropsophus ebraccatus]|uniref:PHD and RING finger domain-containing protein 1 n=1 Tax=Dendropsophus ebraccatus TaxID=150705 RepID=UPI00383209D7
MDDEENQDQLINRNTSHGKSRRQGPFVASNDEDVEESDGSGSEEEDDMDEEDGEEEDGSDSEEEEEEDEEDQEDLPQGSSDPTLSALDLNEAMSSDEERENCPICLNGFRDQVVGTPENCNHYFCLDCILEWSKNANSCPVDRITFSCIHIRAHYGGEILKKVPVQSKADEILIEDDNPTNCEVCGRSDREDRLLLCDGCDAGYHMECLTPPINAVPVDEWFCPECAANNQPDDDAVSEGEVTSLLADVVPTTSRLRTNVVRTRAIARTRQSERVRASVNRIRTTARSSQNVPRYLLSSLLDETIEAVVAGLNTAVYQRNLTPRTTTVRRRRKTGKKTGQSKVSKGSRGVRKRRRRRVKRRKVRKLTNRRVSTSHCRIARSLGIRSPPRGSSLPRIQRVPEQTLDSMRQDIGAATFSVFGNPNDLDPFDSQDDQNSNSSSPLTAKRRVLSRSALRSHRPVARPISVGLSRGRVSTPGSVAVAEPVPDLLGSILSGQSMLMMKSSDIVISRDGSLTAKKSGENSSQNTNSREDLMSASFTEPSPSHSGSPTISSSVNTWKPVVQQPPLSFPSSGLYSLSPSPSPPPSSPSSRAMDRLSMPNSSMPGIPSFRLKNAFTPRVVQVQSSAGRLASKGTELPRLNGTLHKPESPSLNDPVPPKPPEIKHPSKPPAKRLEISEFPRIPKIKKETDTSPNNEDSRRPEATSSNAGSSFPRPAVNQLTGRGESRQLGRFATTQNTEKNSRQESQAPSRPSGGISSSHTASSSSKAPLSNSARNVGSSDSGGGGLRITISGSSNSCRQFSPSVKDPFRTSEGKTQQKPTSNYPSTIKREKNVKNEIYDPFEPTGSDSGSQNSSPERPATPPIPSTSTENTSTAQSSGVKVGAFRSFKLTTHSSRVAVSKLGPDFSGMSPNNKEPQEAKSPVRVSPVPPPLLKVDKEIKKEVKEEITEHTPFRISCPLSGLKITSDLKAGGTRGFHFDVEDQPKISIKSEPDILPNRTFHQSTAGSRVVWEAETPSESSSLSITHSIEPQKRKIIVKEEPRSCSRSRSRTRSRERESRSASLSTEDRERKYKSKSHKVKRSRSDRSSSGSWERSKKKRQKERKKEKKKKSTDSRERKRSRSSSRSTSSHRAYNSKKKKKKKRDSRSESAGRSISPEKEKKRKHKSDKSNSNKEGSSKVKEKKKPKDDRGKQRSRSQPVTKELKVHKSRDKSPTYRDQEVTRHIVLSPNNNETTITCTVSFKSDSPTVVQETKKSILIPKEEVHEKNTFPYLEGSVSVKEEKVELSDCDEEVVKMETESPPWSPSLLDSLVPEDKSENIPEPPSPKESSPLSDLLATSVVSPQASFLSDGSEPVSPKSRSPHQGDHSKTIAALTVKKEADDDQWSPSHLDDFLLNELSDDVCSVGAASPDDVDLEEAILMKREGDGKEPTVINFSKKAAIPFLQDDETSGDGRAGNHIDEKTTNNRNSTVEVGKSDGLKEVAPSSVPKSKPQIKRVTWNLHHKDENTTTEESVSSPYCSTQSEAWADAPKFTANDVTSFKPDPSSETSSPLVWNTPDASLKGSDLLHAVSQGSWNTGSRIQNSVLVKSEDKAIAHAVNKPLIVSVDRHTTRQVKDTSQIPWISTDTPPQVFPQTLPPLPLPPVFPPFAPVSEPTIPCVVQSSRAMPSQTPKPGSLATANEPKMQAASTGEAKGKSKPKKGEKVKNEEYMKKLHMQERAVEEVKLAIKPFYQKREITKDEYKEILRKAVQKICHSKSGEINPVKVVNLVKGYVDKYKHIRNKQKKSGSFEDHDLGRESPI